MMTSTIIFMVCIVAMGLSIISLALALSTIEYNLYQILSRHIVRDNQKLGEGELLDLKWGSAAKPKKE